MQSLFCVQSIYLKAAAAATLGKDKNQFRCFWVIFLLRNQREQQKNLSIDLDSFLFN